MGIGNIRRIVFVIYDLINPAHGFQIEKQTVYSNSAFLRAFALAESPTRMI